MQLGLIHTVHGAWAARGRARWLAAPVLASAVAGSCSVRQMAVDGLGDALVSQGGVFASDDDPELVRAALPFGLKTIEALIEASPDNVDLRLAACRGFTQYSGAFVQGDADLIEWEDYEEASRLWERALKLYLRARVDIGLFRIRFTRNDIYITD